LSPESGEPPVQRGVERNQSETEQIDKGSDRVGNTSLTAKPDGKFG